VRFAGARFKAADVKGASFPEADFSEAHLGAADFSGANLRRAVLVESNAREANFEGARLDGVFANNARLGGANLRGACLSASRLIGADLAGADLTGADLSAADLSGADLSGTILADAMLCGAVLDDAAVDGVDWQGLDLSEVEMGGLDPALLGLTEDQIGQLARFGVPHDPSATLHFESVVAAQVGDRFGLVWENLDNEVLTSIRWAVVGGRKKDQSGVLQIPPESVVARAMLPMDEGFSIVITRRTATGFALVVYGLSTTGELSNPETYSLGYDPLVQPIVAMTDDGLRVWGVARRGPTLVIQGLEPGEGLVPRHSERLPTARGFLGRRRPVLACKGGVILPVGTRSVLRPMRTVGGFPGAKATAVMVEDRMLTVWFEGPVGDEPGVIRCAWLVARGAAEEVTLGIADAITDLDALAVGDQVWIAWVDNGGRAFRVHLPGGEAELLCEDAQTLCFARLTGTAPATLVVTGTDGSLQTVDHRAKIRSHKQA
jgi:hypothetical protein